MLSGFSSYLFGTSAVPQTSSDDLSTIRLNTRPSEEQDDWLLVDHHKSILSRSNSVQSLNLNFLYDCEPSVDLATLTPCLATSGIVQGCVNKPIGQSPSGTPGPRCTSAKSAQAMKYKANRCMQTSLKQHVTSRQRRYRELLPRSAGRHIRPAGFNNNKRCGNAY